MIVSIKKGCPKIQEQTPGFFTTNLGHDISDFRKYAYLTENTQFSSSSYGTKGYFLETPHYNINYVWAVSDDINIISIKTSNSSDYGIRPVIEVLKKRYRLLNY